MDARGFACRFLAGWEGLRRAVVSSPPAAVLIVDPYAGSGSDPQLAGELRSLLREFPSATALAALRITPGCSRDLRTLGEWGVTDIVALGEDDTPEALGRRLRSVEGRSLQGLLQSTLPPVLPGRARILLATAAETASVAGKGRDLARSLHVSERTVLRWTERALLPPPRRLMAWMRILLAAALLDDPGRTVRSVAHACGYASDGSLRRAMRDFVGAAPSTLRRGGAFQRAAVRFADELARARTRAAGRRPPRRWAGATS